MRIAVGCDHRGIEVKKAVIKAASDAGHACQDFGCFTTEPVDYPDIARPVAEAVARGDCNYGILLCDTGIGMSIAANKIKGIRAALCHNAFSAHRARQHNDANILCLAAGASPEGIAEVVDTFLNTDFEGGRHQRRLNKIKDMEG